MAAPIEWTLAYGQHLLSRQRIGNEPEPILGRVMPEVGAEARAEREQLLLKPGSNGNRGYVSHYLLRCSKAHNSFFRHKNI